MCPKIEVPAEPLCQQSSKRKILGNTPLGDILAEDLMRNLIHCCLPMNLVPCVLALVPGTENTDSRILRSRILGLPSFRS